MLLVEAFLRLAAARLAVTTRRFERISKSLGQPMTETVSSVPPELQEVVRRVGRSVVSLALRTPWDSSCLVQAIAARRMLRHRGIPSTLYLGAGLSEGEGLEAHAWLRCGDEILTGGDAHERYTAVATYAD